MRPLTYLCLVSPYLGHSPRTLRMVLLGDLAALFRVYYPE